MALQSLVRTGKREARLLVMVEPPAGPAIGVVTLRAGIPEATGMMLIIVAARARARRVLEGWRTMAFFTRHSCVEANERKPCEVVIERNFLAPAGFVVTLVAARSELPFVSIILLVASDTCCRELVAIEIAFVTRVALHLGMTAKQRKLGGLGMVEVHRLPDLRRMTGLALRAVSSAMRVLETVTSTARPGQILVVLADMAGGAGDLGVRADQCEPRLGMVEKLDTPPCLLAVAAVALLSETSFMRV